MSIRPRQPPLRVVAPPALCNPETIHTQPLLAHAPPSALVAELHAKILALETRLATTESLALGSHQRLNNVEAKAAACDAFIKALVQAPTA